MRQLAAWRVPVQMAVLAGVVAAVVTAGRTDAGTDVVSQLGPAVAAPASWPWVLLAAAVALPVLSLLHYLLSAVAVRAASGHRLSLRTTVLAQLAAAAANRITPHGVGGAALNGRYLLRAGQQHGGAFGALGALGVVGALSDAGFTAAVLTPGSFLHLPGSKQQLVSLTQHGVRLGQRLSWSPLVVVGLLVLVGIVLVKRGVRLPPLRRTLRQAGVYLAGLLRRPARLVVLILASAGTTAALAVAFTATVVVVAGPHQPLAVGTLVITYLVAAAIGTAAPVPAFVGATEAALVTGLVLAGMAFWPAVVATVVFRLVSFWLPLPLGLLAGRRLRQVGLL